MFASTVIKHYLPKAWKRLSDKEMALMERSKRHRMTLLNKVCGCLLFVPLYYSCLLHYTIHVFSLPPNSIHVTHPSSSLLEYINYQTPVG